MPGQQSPKGNLHQRWQRRFRSRQNLLFFQLFLDGFFATQPPGARRQIRLLDAGCGTGEKLRLVSQRGFVCHGCDSSAYALSQARIALEARPNIELCQTDLKQLPYLSAQFDYVLCWGTLMHIEAISPVLRELTRVTKPGGLVIFSEINMQAPEARLTRGVLRSFFTRSTLTETRFGVEIRRATRDGPMFLRHSNIGALTEEFERHGLEMVDRLPGEFTELYKAAPLAVLKRPLHAWNLLYLRAHLSPRWANGNILVFRKPGATG